MSYDETYMQIRRCICKHLAERHELRPVTAKNPGKLGYCKAKKCHCLYFTEAKVKP